jgi:hypothetical protein
MDEKRWTQIFAVCGILFIVFAIAGSVLPGNPPSSDASNGSIVSFYRDNRTAVLVGAYLSSLGIFAAMFFFGGLWRVLRRADGGDGVLSVVALAAGFATAVVVLVAGTTTAALSYHAAGQGDQTLTRGLFDLGNVLYNMIDVPVAALLVAAGIVMVRTGTVSRVLGWAALLIAVVELIAVASFANSGPFMAGGPIPLTSFVVFALWVVATSVTILVQTLRAPALAAAPSPA